MTWVMLRRSALAGLLLGVLLASGWAQNSPRARGPQHVQSPFTGVTPFNLILGNPTESSVVVSMLSYDQDRSVTVLYGKEREKLLERSIPVVLQAGTPTEMTLERLQPDTRYFYGVADASTQAVIQDGTFHTQRVPRATFSFTVTADSHLDQNTDPKLYQRTLANALSDAPDFHIDLGDTFMTEKYEQREQAASQYLAQRYYFGEVAHSMPIFLVLGNHDGEEARQWRAGTQSPGAWAQQMRTRFFPNPRQHPLQDYYAWHWGDCLFVVLNPYTYAASRRTDERWSLSLGDQQYQWLQRTLASSKARFKVMLIHQLLGGINSQGRGGVEGAMYGEWGGHNADGTQGFSTHRVGWAEPIHALLVRHKVNIVLHGHDHVFATQELDGIVYQEVPQPGHPGPGNKIGALAGGYQSGVILGDSGHLLVTVSPLGILVQFKGTDRQILHEYMVAGGTSH